MTRNGHSSPQLGAPYNGMKLQVHPILATAAIMVAVFAAHAPSIWADRIWDDNLMVYANPMIHAGDGLYRFWFTREAPDYWPLTSTMFWIEWRIWGNNPLPYHVANTLLHALGAILLWRVLRRLNVNEAGAWLAGLIFAVHPVTVESVAWVAERKNVLSIVLYLLSILAYLRFQDDGGRRWYVGSLIAAFAALLAKTSVVMLPPVLLLCLWWKRGRVTRKDLVGTLPFFALSAVFGLLTLWFQHGNNAAAGLNVRPESFASRLAASGWVVWFYLYKILLPIRLAMVYPRWNVDVGQVLSFVPLGLLIVCMAVLWRFRAGWARAPLAAMTYFVVTLVPVMGFVGMTYAVYSLVADHLQYLPMIGIIALAGGLAGSLIAGPGTHKTPLARGAGLAIVCAVVVTLATLTWRQSRVYLNEGTLWTHTLAINDAAWVGYLNRGAFHCEHKNFEQAIEDCTQAIARKPDHPDPFYNRGYAHAGLGRFDLAIPDYTRSIELRNDDPDTYFNRATAYLKTNAPDRALADFRMAAELGMNTAALHFNVGNALLALGRLDEAIASFARAIKLQPDHASAYVNRGTAYRRKGMQELAIQDCGTAIGLNPKLAEAWNNRGISYAMLGALDKALADYAQAIRVNESYAEAWFNRGNAHTLQGNHAEAVLDYSQAIELQPTLTHAYNARAAAYVNLQQFDKALADLTRCRELGGKPNPDLIRLLQDHAR